MIIGSDLVRASVARWRREAAQSPSALSKQLGEGARAHMTVDQQRSRYAALLDQARDPIVARTQLERIIAGNDLTGVNYLAIGYGRARCVCRVHLRDASGGTTGFGTGFLVARGVLMTNHHVIGGAEEARGALAEFQYEFDVDGSDRPVVTFEALVEPAPIADEALDFCLVRLAPRSIDGRHAVDEFGWLPLDPTPGKAVIGEYLTIIQHPSGERKQICVRENKLLKYDEEGNTIWYNTDTAAGSSGSPVFSDTWKVVALHHSGVPATNAKGQWLTTDGRPWDRSMDETRVQWVANEGVRISAIAAFLQAQHAGDSLARQVLSPGTPPPFRAPWRGTPEAVIPSSELIGDELHVTIPVRVAVSVGSRAGRPANGEGNSGEAPAVGDGRGNGRPSNGFGTATAAGLALAARGVERIVIDQDNYDERPGYDPQFLGAGKRAVPLPRVVAARLKKSLLTWGTGSRKASELRYWNYSVLVNKDRRLAFLSAINVDSALRKGERDKDGDRWFYDTRIDERYQLGTDFYPLQRTFEIDRTANPFDRGHLSARHDAQWGRTPTEAKRNGDDSFHWVNCSPQHYRFNQGQKLWAGLEDYVISAFAASNGGRASVFNGPVFDAPLSRLGPDGRPALDLAGKSHSDPTFGGVAIPKMFFKVVASTRAGRLVAAAFIISQEDLLATERRVLGLPPLEQERLTAAEARAFQVSVADVAALTGLDFGPLVDADTAVRERATVSGPHEIARYQDAVLSAT